MVRRYPFSMKLRLLSVILFCIVFSSRAQEYRSVEHIRTKPARKTAAVATSLDAGISVSVLRYLPFNPVRIIHDDRKKVLYISALSGDVYQMPLREDGSAGAETLLISASEHNINYLQGLEYHDNTFYLVGNENDAANFHGRGRVQKCVINPDGSHTWTHIMTTELYPSSGTLYDHAFAGVCLSRNKDTLFVSSGSRTDHGEVKNSGAYTGLREVPLTAKIFAFPVSVSDVILRNEQEYIESSGFLYADGTRNEFDMAINGHGHLIGLENSGDRDDAEELNWLRKGRHYGFPWRMGGNDTPMQFVPYNAAADKLVPADALARGIFYNDPAFPPRPAGVTFEEPVLNYGPDANWLRSPADGKMHQGAVSTFTSHRSPLGLVFDNDSTMAAPYLGNGFMFAYSYLGDPFSAYLPEEDGGGDMCLLELTLDGATGRYSLNTTRLISGLGNVTDAAINGNIIYFSELQGAIYQVIMPRIQKPQADFSFELKSECSGTVQFTNLSAGDAMSFRWDFGDGSSSAERSPVHTYATPGNYTVTLSAHNSSGVTGRISMTVPVALTELTVNIKSPGSTVFCPEDEVVLEAVSASGVEYQWYKNEQAIQGASGSGYTVNEAGLYKVTVRKGEECTASSESKEITYKNNKPAIALSDYVVLTASAGSTSYQWYLNGVLLPGAVQQTHIAEKPGKYKVLASPENCQAAFSDEIDVILLGNERYSLKLSPNPVENILYFTLTLPEAEEVSLKVLNSIGQAVMPEMALSRSMNHQAEISTRQWPSGVYFAVVKTTKYEMVRKIVRL